MGTLKKLQEEFGVVTGMALNDLVRGFNNKLATFNAIRTAQGKMTLQEDLDDGIAVARQMVADGEMSREEYLDLIGEEPPDNT
ncbi:hypothetical protein [Cupriavidus pampae]|uniref:Uncharacterized protein n=1 Tax=Cupriavidus pampae TaxID=659251 RepID=A0ABM8XC11_9BURK|nr:hypothetical protein [Cupriavidus pampae]CAG9177607.1 hypothetical protein LMG32289_03855 [Cupriavidus pampae]